MNEVTWTPEELAKFNRLTLRIGSPDQVTRIDARLQLHAFVAQHGKPKCDAMFEHLTQKVEK